MVKKYILAHDLGTSGNKVSLYDNDGSLISSTFCAYNTYYPHNGWVEQYPEDWWAAFKNATRELLNKSKISKNDIACITFSGQMMSALPVDKKCNPLSNSIIWADTRGVAQADRLGKNIDGKEIYKITGHRCSPNYSAAKIMWFLDNKKEVYKNAYKFLHVKDFIIGRLTNAFVTDYSDASGMNLLDINNLDWSGKLVEAAGIDNRKLPELLASSDIAGEVTVKAARETGLMAGTPVIAGGGDGPCAALGAGVINEGSAYNYIGSSSWIGVSSMKPVMDSEMRTFNWVHLDKNRYCPTGTMQAAGGSYSWLKDRLYPSDSDMVKEGTNLFKLMDKKAEEVPAGSEGLIYLPYLLGERSPHWNPDARGAFIGLTYKHSRKHIIRAVLEGITFNLKIILNAFEKQLSINSIKVIGGGAKGVLWQQILADIYEMPVLVPQFLDEATSLGAAIAGGVGIGLFKNFEIANELIEIKNTVMPVAENSKIYKKLFPVFKESYKALIPVFDKIKMF